MRKRESSHYMGKWWLDTAECGDRQNIERKAGKKIQKWGIMWLMH